MLALLEIYILLIESAPSAGCWVLQEDGENYWEVVRVFLGKEIQWDKTTPFV